MVAMIIAYGMSGFFGVLAVGGIVMAFTEDRKKLSPPRLLSTITLFGFAAWAFARMGGI